MYIKSTAERIAKRCGRNPFDVAEQLGIIIVYEPLGTIRGYYSKNFRQKFIHINCDMPEYLKNFVCAHEVGHAILHENLNTPFLRNNTLLSVNRYEVEANQFTACLLLSDQMMIEYSNEYGYTIPQIARCTGLPETLVEYRFKTLEDISVRNQFEEC